MVDRIDIVSKDLEKYGFNTMLKVVLLAIYRTSRGLYESCKKDVLIRFNVEAFEDDKKEYIDGHGRPYKPIFKDGKLIAQELI